jgi:hypothetical protein
MEEKSKIQRRIEPSSEGCQGPERAVVPKMGWNRNITRSIDRI